jgi:large subunit ribosomal protein L1
METIIRMKPAAAKGVYIRGISLSTTMGPGLKLDPQEIRNIVK